MSPENPPRSTSSDDTPSGSMSQASAIDHIVKCYGDLLFDLCESVLWSPLNAQLAFRTIIQEIKRRLPKECFTDHERAWVLSIACQQLRNLSGRHGRKLTSSEQIELDSSQSATHRLKKFDSYFHRLSADDQLLLLLKDKYGIPFPEIASAMSAPEDSLKVRRQQSLRTLEDWIWENA